MRLTLDDLSAQTRRHGTPTPGARKLFSIMRDEMALLPSFLAHYRALGIEQFLIFDDGSSDGTRETLAAQPDVVLYEARHRFGKPVEIVFPDDTSRKDRFGTWVKAALPHVEAPGEIVAYFDADEFLILPPGVTSLAEVFDTMTRGAIPAICASVVEFFPETLAGLDGAMPDTPKGLFAAYPFFEPEPLVTLIEGERPDPFGTSKTNKLFEEYGIDAAKPTFLQRLTGRKPKPRFKRSPRHKLPLLRRDAETWQVGSHYANRPPSADHLLTIAHFVFTAEFAAKIARARRWKAHTEGAAKYDHYDQLLGRMRAEGGRFTGPASTRYTDPQQLIDVGLMRWPGAQPG
ncbi:Glycosyl transferase family 2 [Roseivivax lentus]|uniref:Glycosyl transferase family 2 n=1 Tax=Roseivivax lentus TaxID=633194 RepID=A0A1N7MYT4_9RHOB|nr:glycosyltransferase family 2 protein [Roseivivax lentus]SIS91250.1 Glycosyl transferase family 2 [Roseivivax lentus]